VWSLSEETFYSRRDYSFFCGKSLCNSPGRLSWFLGESPLFLEDMSNADQWEFEFLRLLGELILVGSLGNCLSCLCFKQLNNLLVSWGVEFNVISLEDHSFELKSWGN
jgi:hypothetical protein